jgi:hypothetical protein
MSGIKEKNHLEEIRKLHRKLREAKEDPTHGGLAGLPQTDSGYGEVELAPGASAYDAQQVEGLDHEVQLDVQEGSPNSRGAAAAEAASSVVSPNRGSAGSRGKKKTYEPEPTLDEEPYEAAPAVAVRSGRSARAAPPPVEEDSYDEESTTAGAGYAQQDEYDEEN